MTRLVGRDGFVGRSMFLWMDGVTSAWGREWRSQVGVLCFQDPSPPFPYTCRLDSVAGLSLGDPWCWKSSSLQWALWEHRPGVWISALLCVCVCPDLSGFGVFFSTMAIIIAYLKGTHQAPKK